MKFSSAVEHTNVKGKSRWFFFKTPFAKRSHNLPGSKHDQNVIWKRRFHSQNESKMFSVVGEIWKRNCHQHFAFVFELNSGRGNIVIIDRNVIVFEKLHFQSVSRQGSTIKREGGVFSWFLRFEERFSKSSVFVKAVWMVGLIGEIKLRFQIPPALRGRGFRE